MGASEELDREQEITQSTWFKTITEFCEQISGTLPIPGRYILGVDGAALEGHKRTSLAPLESWIRSAAPGLTVGKTGAKATNVTQTVPPQVPFPVTLGRHPSSTAHPDGALTVASMVEPAELPALNIVQMSSSLNEKLPKLEQHRPPGGRTLLVLENRDIQLPNHDSITYAIRAALAENLNLPKPDAIVVVDKIGAARTLTFINDDDRWYDESQTPWNFPDTTLGPGPENRLLAN
jgi:hypothetical protein